MPSKSIAFSRWEEFVLVRSLRSGRIWQVLQTVEDNDGQLAYYIVNDPFKPMRTSQVLSKTQAEIVSVCANCFRNEERYVYNINGRCDSCGGTDFS